MKKLKIFIFAIMAFCLPLSAFAQVTFEPIYASERFQPSDMFHATCENQLNVIFSLPDTKITGISAVLDYNSNDIEILKIAGENEKANNLSYVVNDNKIYLNKLKSEGGADMGSNMVVFSIYLKSQEGVTDTLISFADGSYMVDSDGKMINLSNSVILQFAPVPECEPDIVSPKVNLLFPKVDEWVALDTYFQFDISDLGKGINEDSVVLTINGTDYDINTMEHEWDMNVLTIYPNFWMPFNTGFEVKLSVSDKQVYGGANTVTKTYNLETMDEMYLLNKIDPVEFRMLVNSQKYYKGTKQECDFLADAYSLSQHEGNAEKGEIILSVNKRISCPDIQKGVGNYLAENTRSLSLFSVLGWTLFVCSFLIAVLLACKGIKK